jgi:hypothetical protein
MTEMEKSIITLLLALTQKVYSLSEIQFSTNRVLSQLPIADETLRQTLRDAVARGESLHDQGQALLADVQALLKRI